MNYLKFLALFVLFSSCDDLIEVEDISQQTVAVLAPTNNSVIRSASVTFSWAAVADADHYRLQLATPSFDQAAQISIDSLVTTSSLTTEVLPNLYEWRIRAENSGYVTPFSSQNFEVQAPEAVDISSEIVELLAPGDGLVFATTDAINFSWDPVANANSYSFQIAIPSFDNTTQIISNETISATTFSVSGLEVSSYQWRVRALNFTYETAYTTQSFTVE